MSPVLVDQAKSISNAMAKSTKIHAVLGILFNPKLEVLVAQRPSNKPLAGFWEFPGGKIEDEETPFQALNREMQEEIGIEVISANFLQQIHYDYPDKSVQLQAWEIINFSGEPLGKEGQEVLWLKIEELVNRSFLPANKEVIEIVIKLASSRLPSEKKDSFHSNLP